MIGASIEQLESLSGALGQTGVDITDVNTNSQSAATEAVTEMNRIAEAARAAIETAMDQMIQAVGRSRSELNGADWTGENRATFDGHYGNFETAMTSAQTNTNDTFNGLKATIGQMGEQIDAYALEISTALTAASDSSTAMSTAVTTQKTNLENAMSGMAVG